MTIEQLIKDYAKQHGYSGLYNSERECGCSLDEHHPCENLCNECKFGYVVECKDCGIKDSKAGCPLRDEGCDMCVRQQKPKDIREIEIMYEWYSRET